MSNKSKKRNRKKRAKVKVAALLHVEPNKKIAVLEIDDAPEPKKEISTWQSFKNWLGSL